MVLLTFVRSSGQGLPWPRTPADREPFSLRTRHFLSAEWIYSIGPTVRFGQSRARLPLADEADIVAPNAGDFGHGQCLHLGDSRICAPSEFPQRIGGVACPSSIQGGQLKSVQPPNRSASLFGKTPTVSSFARRSSGNPTSAPVGRVRKPSGGLAWRTPTRVERSPAKSTLSCSVTGGTGVWLTPARRPNARSSGSWATPPGF